MLFMPILSEQPTHLLADEVHSAIHSKNYHMSLQRGFYLPDEKTKINI